MNSNVDYEPEDEDIRQEAAASRNRLVAKSLPAASERRANPPRRVRPLSNIMSYRSELKGTNYGPPPNQISDTSSQEASTTDTEEDEEDDSSGDQLEDAEEDGPRGEQDPRTETSTGTGTGTGPGMVAPEPETTADVVPNDEIWEEVAFHIGAPVHDGDEVRIPIYDGHPFNPRPVGRYDYNTSVNSGELRMGAEAVAPEHPRYPVSSSSPS